MRQLHNTPYMVPEPIRFSVRRYCKNGNFQGRTSTSAVLALSGVQVEHQFFRPNTFDLQSNVPPGHQQGYHKTIAKLAMDFEWECDPLCCDVMRLRVERYGKFLGAFVATIVST